MANAINKFFRELSFIKIGIIGGMLAIGIFFANSAMAATYSVNVSAVGNGSVTPSGIFSANYGDSLSFMVMPDPGNHISSVLVNGINIGTPTSFFYTFITSDLTIIANFAPDAATNNITATAGTNGSIAPSGITSVNFGANQTYTITPNIGYTINNVLIDGDAIGPVSSYQFNNVMIDHTIEATFTSGLSSISITSSASAGGTISPLGVITISPAGSQIYMITPNVGYHIVEVIVDGVSQGVLPTYTFSNVNISHTISATFAADSFTITSTAGANGIISPLGPTAVVANGSQVYAITPNTNYSITDVLVDGTSVGAVSTYTFNNVLANHTISATFSPMAITSSLVLSPGYNLVTLPIQPMDTLTGLPINYTAETFGKLAGADIVAEWNASTQQYNSHVVGLPINDFSLTNGLGFFVHVTTGVTLNFTGTPFPQVAPVLSTGWNLLGWNSSLSTNADAFGLSLVNSGTQVSTVDVVDKFDGLTQQWNSHIINLPLNNFTINQGDGIFVHKP
jgi:hypothetical protein